MKLMGFIVVGGVILAGSASPFVLRGMGQPEEVKPSSRSTATHPAANGVVEGARPEVALRTALAGTVAAVFVRENDDVEKGRLLIELQNDTQKQQVALAEAELACARAKLERLRNGESREKREVAAAVENARRAVYRQAKADWERCQRLAGSQSVSAQQRDADYYRMLRCQAEAEEAAAERARIEAPARTEEVAAAEAEVAGAEARLRLAQTELAKTRLLAPSAGRILRVAAEPGEAADPRSPQPLLLMADLSRYRVRAFVEELDAPRVRVGQRVVVTEDGLPGREFTGRVAVTLPRMGKRNQPSDAAEEYRDLYYREVLIDLDGGDTLTLNLRVQVQIEIGEDQ
jgi:HlyD family secretion protein